MASGLLDRRFDAGEELLPEPSLLRVVEADAFGKLLTGCMPEGDLVLSHLHGAIA